MNFLENPLYSDAFQVFQIGGGCRKDWFSNDWTIAASESIGIRSNTRRKVSDINELLVPECNSSFHAVFQFTHVSRPVVLSQAVNRGWRDLNRLSWGITAKEPLHQFGDVVA